MSLPGDRLGSPRLPGASPATLCYLPALEGLGTAGESLAVPPGKAGSCLKWGFPHFLQKAFSFIGHICRWLEQCGLGAGSNTAAL